MTPEQLQQILAQHGMASHPLLEFFAEHPELTFALTILWHMAVVVILAVLCWEVHTHNAREERRDFQRQFAAEREERRNPFAGRPQAPPQNPDARYLPKA